MITVQPTIESNLKQLRTLEQRFNERLIDQPQAVTVASQVIKRVAAGFFDDRSPLSILFFAGPTGVGKTELVKMIAEELDWPLHRYDMSEFSAEFTVSRFLGAPPGYKGFDQGGELVNALRKTPCVVLFDEIEKAHQNVTKVFLQLFDEGRLTDSKGNTVSAKQSIICMTSNLGSQPSSQEISQTIETLIIERFSPEFFGRIHKVVVFNPLKATSILKIGRNYFATLVANIERTARISIKWDDNVVNLILKDCDVYRSGARGLQRKIQENLFHALTEPYIQGLFRNGDTIQLTTTASDQLAITLHSRQLKENAPQSQPIANDYPSQAIEKDLPPNRFIGKWAFHIPFQMEAPFFITDVDKNGHISSISKEGIQVIGGSIYSKGWQLPTPKKHPQAYFENLCADLETPFERKLGLFFVKEIFNEIKVQTLSNSQPFADLKTRVNGKKLLSTIERLEKLLRPVMVNLFDPDPEPNENIEVLKGMATLKMLLGDTSPKIEISQNSSATEKKYYQKYKLGFDSKL